ncbi:TraR/DksA family transcriptional regulator [Streptomyces benahoarensis]|uniref:DNA-binding protein n=1 Tax=Streptomyces benahoarensis TaxID=2595054 RepID=A0A553XDJ0_9ACTN|nr:TraR/DksA C4-type zinc finger protein [Streptomyces benahoarensis]TSB15021.1 DNA-binding protein [Streptomyces benahoarensis]TSB25676.1 DNA-binding protein [Streptomyces benahoarensis]
MVAKKSAAKKSTTPAEEPGAARPAAPQEAGAAASGTQEKQGPARKAAAKKAAVEKAPAKKAAARKSTARKTAAAKAPAKKATAAKATARKTGAKKVAKKTAAAAHGTDPAVPAALVAAAPDDLAVRPGEAPWTPEEVDEARAGLLSEAERLRTEIAASEDAIAGLMRDSGDGAGDDEADTGTKNITREHELALASNAREMLLQTERALGRLDAGTYGLCENCGNPIGKARMQAFPRATLCVECKQKQERRG